MCYFEEVEHCITLSLSTALAFVTDILFLQHFPAYYPLAMVW